MKIALDLSRKALIRQICDINHCSLDSDNLMEKLPTEGLQRLAGEVMGSSRSSDHLSLGDGILGGGASPFPGRRLSSVRIKEKEETLQHKIKNLWCWRQWRHVTLGILWIIIELSTKVTQFDFCC